VVHGSICLFMFRHVTDRNSITQVPQEVRSTFWMAEAPGFVAASIKGDVLALDFWDVRLSARAHSIRKRANSFLKA